jgi:hypothetical protein
MKGYRIKESPILKTCKKCKKTFPNTEEFFYADAQGYLRGNCRWCQSKSVYKRSKEREILDPQFKKYQQLKSAQWRKKKCAADPIYRQKVNQASLDYYHIPEHKYKAYQRGAIQRGHSWELTYPQFETLLCQPCFYCGAHSKVGVDRVDNTQGYTVDNSVPCCADCNMLKGTWPATFFVAKCKQIAEYYRY